MENLGVTAGFWRDRPVLVTGATGLLGGWLLQSLLEKGAEVVCLVRDWVPQSRYVRSRLADRAKTVRGDICDGSLLARVVAEYEVDTVFHLAAQTIVGVANQDPISTFESNIRGTWNLLEACRGSDRVKAVVLASSDKAYGYGHILPYREDAPLEGRHPYDVSKSCSDLIAQAYAATYRLPVAITRCGNFYGGGDLNWNRIVPGTIRSVLRRERPAIRSDGQSIRDYLYVEDGAHAYELLARRLHEDPPLRGAAFNFSNETQTTVLALVERILACMGSDLVPDVRDDSRHEIRHQYLSAERARRELDWSPLFTLDEGLERTIAWYREFFAA